MSRGVEVDSQLVLTARSTSRSLTLRRELVLRVELAAVGAIPIVCLALSVLELVPLHLSGPAMIGAAVLVGLVTRALAPDVCREACGGYVAGLIAVVIYDSTRMPFVVIGGWPDFIPKIGAWLFDVPSTHWSVGYAWRYLGNGAGMGLTFAMLVPYVERWIDRRLCAVIYGVFIWTGLVTTLLAAPDGQNTLFQLTPLTIAVSLTGHLVYGAVLGILPQSRGIEPPVHSPTSGSWRRDG